MKILVLNGSPRPNGNTKKMVDAFASGAKSAGHSVTIFDVCKMNIRGCLACEYCHKQEHGVCVQKDDMQTIYPVLNETEMLVLASPIYYHNISGQLKCALDRFYAPDKPAHLNKIAMLLSSGSPDMYSGAEFSYQGDFLDYLKCEGMGIFTSHGDVTEEELAELQVFGAGLS